MGVSPSHKFGQIIGEMVEEAVGSALLGFAQRHGLFLDLKGSRLARKGKRVAWRDEYGNSHDLDFVLERGGTDERIGVPVAFIECAWRRYTKHSRNKAQEIQGAILPLAAKHRFMSPFLGIILAGVYTEGALNQLSSLGFKVLYFPYDSVVQAFNSVGVSAEFDEKTKDAEFLKKVKSWERLPPRDKGAIMQRLLELNENQVAAFLESLEQAVLRQVASLKVTPLHGRPFDLETVEEAMRFVREYADLGSELALLKYEISIRYSNGDQVEASFSSKESALDFLNQFRSPQFDLSCGKHEEQGERSA